jgi:hypothetical protein
VLPDESADLLADSLPQGALHGPAYAFLLCDLELRFALLSGLHDPLPPRRGAFLYGAVVAAGEALAQRVVLRRG